MPAVGARTSNGVMDRIGAHRRNIADAVADAGIADLSPEPLAAGGIGGVEAVMAETGDPGRFWREADVHLGGEVGVVLDACTASGDNSKYLLTSSPAGIANRS